MAAIAKETYTVGERGHKLFPQCLCRLPLDRVDGIVSLEHSCGRRAFRYQPGHLVGILHMPVLIAGITYQHRTVMEGSHRRMGNITLHLPYIAVGL